MEKIKKFFDLNNTLGALSFLMSVVALYLLGVPDKICFVIFSLSFVFQGVVFYRTKQWFLILQMMLLLIFNIVNYIKWLDKGIG